MSPRSPAPATPCRLAPIYPRQNLLEGVGQVKKDIIISEKKKGFFKMKVENISFTVGFSREVVDTVKRFCEWEGYDLNDQLQQLGYWAIGLLEDGGYWARGLLEDGNNINYTNFSRHDTYLDSVFYVQYDLENRLIRISFNEPHTPEWIAERTRDLKGEIAAINSGKGRKSNRRHGKARRKR